MKATSPTNMSETFLAGLYFNSMLTLFSSAWGYLGFVLSGSHFTGVIVSVLLFLAGQAVNLAVNLWIKPWLEERRAGEKKRLRAENEQLKTELSRLSQS